MITIPALAVVGKPPATVRITISREDQWKSTATMPEDYARDLAKECQKRGLTAVVEAA